MKIHGAGCSLVDNLYSPVDFSSRCYRKWLSRDGRKAGLITGGLVFGSDLEKNFGKRYAEIIGEITGDMDPVRNIGGPSIVALIHLAQVLNGTDTEISYFGALSDDEAGRYIIKQLSGFNIDTTSYLITRGGTPFTDVLSDPSYNEQNGERTFINYIGAAGELTGKDLPETFYNAEILILGGTALTPGIHDDLSSILKKGKTRRCLCFVNTVYDFRNQNKDPGRPWPLVEKNEDFKLIDLIIADNEEAFRITGKPDKKLSADFFLSKGVRGGIITHGSNEIVCFSDGTLFLEKGIFTLPVSERAGRLMKNAPPEKTDTTGCGDNFAGGVYASTIRQITENRTPMSLKKAAVSGIIAGGFAGLYLGGVYHEQHSGEKTRKLVPFLTDYCHQTGENYE